MSARFLFVSARPEIEAVAPEYASVRRASGLDADRLDHVRVDVDRLGDLAPQPYAGVIVGGSPFNVTTPDERKSAVQRRVEADLARLAERALAADHPVLFTCYGIGVLTRVLGGTVDTVHGEQASAVEITLTDEGRTDPLTAGLPASFDALVGHKEATGRLPDGAVLLAGSPGCPVQVYRAGTHVYATQFHPEVSTDDFIARARVYRHHGYFPPHELDLLVQRVGAASVTEPRRMLRRFVELAEARSLAAV
ncbi:GMP synthase (glutamine-hydrolyzing) [Agromyces flavus]|uniref:GMP synthase (Glutamine-hydrolysing) n=1 Tax=Agromyces flavus TaxID=589382 RepID=A0A1H1LJJ2_9MICO|nr:glutamine amidotransferase [Agromyces flavus]MCP2368515.1 GMP synthase (glutamine-hydrolyzing) [Agromyces flavus]GGI48244.1 glutamine amidotransferase [Agromyces flavus]SDR74029.1 GMP synthase (glutamine-hydrolysing) [Agromyces flavus]